MPSIGRSCLLADSYLCLTSSSFGLSSCFLTGRETKLPKVVVSSSIENRRSCILTWTSSLGVSWVASNIAWTSSVLLMRFTCFLFAYRFKMPFFSCRICNWHIWICSQLLDGSCRICNMSFLYCLKSATVCYSVVDPVCACVWSCGLVVTWICRRFLSPFLSSVSMAIWTAFAKSKSVSLILNRTFRTALLLTKQKIFVVKLVLRVLNREKTHRYPHLVVYRLPVLGGFRPALSILLQNLKHSRTTNSLGSNWAFMNSTISSLISLAGDCWAARFTSCL